jgi:hypothetical protein
MNLQEFLVTNPNSFKLYCLILTTELAQLLLTTQSKHSNEQFKIYPRELIDGRYVLGADLLTEVQPGGLYHQGWQHLPQERFNEVEVMLWNDIVPLLPVEPGIEEL